MESLNMVKRYNLKTSSNRRLKIMLDFWWLGIIKKKILAIGTKTRTIILFTKTTLNRLGFGVTATLGHFHCQNNETEDKLV